MNPRVIAWLEATKAITPRVWVVVIVLSAAVLGTACGVPVGQYLDTIDHVVTTLAPLWSAP